MKKVQIYKLISLSILFTVLSACSTISSNGGRGERYFSLTPLNESYTGKALSDQLVLGIGPVDIPRLLNRPQIIYRVNNNEVIISEHNQWAGSLQEEIQEVLIERIIEVSGSQRIMYYPWPSNLRPEFEARIRIDRLDGSPGKDVTLEVHWDLLTSKGKDLIVSRKSQYEILLDDEDFLSYVIAQQTALSKLADEILEEIISYQNR